MICKDIITFTAGDTVWLEVEVRDRDGTLMDLSTATPINFAIQVFGRIDEDPVVTKEKADMTILSLGNIRIVLDPVDTADLHGKFKVELEVTDSVGAVSTVLSQELIIERTII